MRIFGFSRIFSFSWIFGFSKIFFFVHQNARRQCCFRISKNWPSLLMKMQYYSAGSGYPKTDHFCSSKCNTTVLVQDIQKVVILIFLLYPIFSCAGFRTSGSCLKLIGNNTSNLWNGNFNLNFACLANSRF